MKRPAFQFYPADWRKDVELQSCSMAAQGLWINLLCVAHECEPYGHLSVNGKGMTAAQIGRQVGLSPREADNLLRELEDNGVIRRTDDGVIYSHRMVKDERLRNIRAEAGRLGGNPNLVAGKVNQTDKQNLTPSSSSSTSVNTKEPNGSCPVEPDPEPQEVEQELPSPGFPPCPYAELLALWKTHLPHLTQPRIWEGNRKVAMRNRWRQAGYPSAYSPDGYSTEAGGLKWWDSFFRYIAQDTSLAHGFETNGRSWMPDLEWVCKPANFQKIIDGKYNK